MVRAKNWVFIFPIIAAIVLLISLLYPIMHIAINIPAIPLLIEGDLLPFGGGIVDELESYIPIVPEAETLQTTFYWLGICFMIFFILGALFLIISAIRVVSGNKELEKARKKWLRNGFSYIIGELILFYGMSFALSYAIEQIGLGLEIIFTMRLGMILILVAGGILIFAYICAKIAG